MERCETPSDPRLALVWHRLELPVGPARLVVEAAPGVGRTAIGETVYRDATGRLLRVPTAWAAAHTQEVPPADLAAALPPMTEAQLANAFPGPRIGLRTPGPTRVGLGPRVSARLLRRSRSEPPAP